jgi:predicted RNase H-like HicB family nuclease
VARRRDSKLVHVATGVTVRPAARGWKTLKTLVYSRAFEIEIERDEDGWLIGSVPEFPGCHTQARTEEDLIERMREAVELALTDSSEPLSKALFCPPLPK